MALEWKTESKKLKDLIPLENNPRDISPKDLELLGKDLDSVGNFRPIIIDTNNTVLGGNQRFKKLLQKHGDDYEVEVTVPSRKLKEDERKKVIIIDNRHRGEDDVEILKEEYLEILAELEYEDLLEEFDDEKYTKEIKTPVYEPENELPELTALVDTEKADELIAEINTSDLDNDIKEFLVKAATRLYTFRYDRIADYYANTNEEAQDLMERLALIIIDYEKAIEYGFVQLTEYLREMQAEENE